MPELPEVETTIRSLRPFLVGSSIDRIEVLSHNMFADTDGLLPMILKKRITDISRRGKYIIVRFASPAAMIVHLKISGRLGLRAREAAHLRYERIRFFLGNRDVLVFNDPRTLGRVRIVDAAAVDRDRSLSSLGPDALEVSGAVFADRMEKRGIPIKQLLLDQGFVAGIGNIYADEACFGACIDPRTPASTLSKRKRVALHEAVRKVLIKGIDNCGTSIADFADLFGKPGQNQSSLSAYGRAGMPCVRCGTTLKKCAINGRSTVWCSRCQV